MNKLNMESAPLEQRIRQWIGDNPGRAQAGERMLEQLHRIRTEFTGDTAIRLEALVGETLDRQLRIDASRKAGMAAAQQLSLTMRRLTESMSTCLVTARKAHDAAVGAALSVMSAKAKARVQNNPMRHQPLEKKYVN